MKKLLAIILAVAMVMSMAVVTSADSVGTNEIVVFDKPEGDNLGGVDSWCGVGYTDGYGNLGETRAFLEGVIELSEIKELFSRGGTKFEYTFGASYIDYYAKGGPSANINFGIDVYTTVAITDLGDGMYKGVVELDELLAAWEAAGYTVNSSQFVGFVIQIWCSDFVLYNAKFITAKEAPEGYELGQLTKANFGSSGWDSTYADGVITYDGAWTGRGWWIGSDNPMTGYDSMIIEFPGAEIPAQVVVDYVDETLTDTSTAINAGATDVTVALDHEAGISQIYIQAKEAGTLTLGDVYMRTYVEPAPEAPEAIDVALYESEEGNTFTGDATTYLDPWGGFGICSEVNGQNVGNISLAELITYAEMEGAELVITFEGDGFWGGSKPETEVQFNCWDTEEDLQVKFDITTLPSGINKGVVKFETLISKLEALGLTTADIRNLGVQVWASNFKLHTVAIHVPAPEVEEETYRGSGYFMTGEETHAMIIGKAIITTPHEFDENGDCKYCRYHTEVVVEDIIVEQPTESTEEESEDITVEEPKEDTNPGTGLTLAVIPAIVALAAVVISKR